MTSMSVLRRTLAGCAAAAALGAGAFAQPQDGAASPAPLPSSYRGPASAVAAVVNDKVITTHDVQQRVRLMVLTSGGRITPEMLPQVQQHALRELIEEQLKFAEGAKFKVQVDDREIDDEILLMTSQTGVSIEELKRQLAAAGIEMRGLQDQVRASLVWQRIVQGRFRDRVRINEDEITAQLERMREDATKEQYLVSEICIPVASPREAEELYRGSLNLIDQMRRGVPFAVVAQQFSACSSAAAGGDLGWVRAGEMPPELDEALRVLPPGAVTNPIPSEGALMILAMRDKRPAQVAGEETLTLVYAGAPESLGKDAAMRAFEKIGASDACAGPATLRQDIGPGVGVALLEGVKMGDIDERFQFSVEGVGRGELGAVVEADGAYHVAFVCERDEGLGLPSRQALEDRAFGRALTRIAQQYLRDIERKASVDIRLETPQPRSGR